MGWGKDISWTLLAVTRMPFCVNTGIIPTINGIHIHKTHSTRICKVLHKSCIASIFLYHPWSTENSISNRKKCVYNKQLGNCARAEAFVHRHCTNKSHSECNELGTACNFTTFHSLFFLFYYSSLENNCAGNWQRVKRMSKTSQLAPSSTSLEKKYFLPSVKITNESHPKSF